MGTPVLGLPRLAGRLTADLILCSPQEMNAISEYQIDLRGARPNHRAPPPPVGLRTQRWRSSCTHTRVVADHSRASSAPERTEPGSISKPQGRVDQCRSAVVRRKRADGRWMRPPSNRTSVVRQVVQCGCVEAAQSPIASRRDRDHGSTRRRTA